MQARKAVVTVVGTCLALAALGAAPAAAKGKGPDPEGPAKFGLCKAYAAGQGGEKGKKHDSTAFKALIQAAGGKDQVRDFCADALREKGETGATTETDDEKPPKPAKPEKPAKPKPKRAI